MNTLQIQTSPFWDGYKTWPPTGKIPGRGLNDGGVSTNSCKKNRSHAPWCLKPETTCNVWVWSQWTRFPFVTSNTFNTWVDGFSLLRYKLSPALCHAAHNIHTQLVCFFDYLKHDFTQWQCQAMSGKPQRFLPKMKPPRGDVMTKRQVSITEDVTVALVSHCRVKDSMLMPFTFEEKWWKLGLIWGRFNMVLADVVAMFCKK